VPASIPLPASTSLPPSAICGTQAEPTHDSPDTQSADVVQPLGQDAELPEQSSPSLQDGWPAECAASGMQVPVAQEPHGPQALSQQMAETQCADWHWSAPEHAAPFVCRATQAEALQ